MERVVQKVLDGYLGKFIQGFDRENLKVASLKGDIVVEGTSLRKEAIEQLDVPVRLVYSHIGRLSAKIPYAKISSQPVEIAIEDVYILLEPLQRGEWNFANEADVLRRKA